MLLELHLLCVFALSVQGHSSPKNKNGEFTKACTSVFFILYFVPLTFLFSYRDLFPW